MAATITTVPFADLRAFQRDILGVLAREGATYGLGIKRELNELYGEQINHGRLYSNLDELAEEDLITIGALDKRTNEYALSEKGRRAIKSNHEWLDDCMEETR